jgi:hypothetical protein
MLLLVVTPEMIRSELERYQLFGRVTEVPGGYQIDAQFRGKSGTYNLPEQVETVEML